MLMLIHEHNFYICRKKWKGILESFALGLGNKNGKQGRGRDF